MRFKIITLFIFISQYSFSQNVDELKVLIKNETKNNISAYSLDELYYGKPLFIKKGMSIEITCRPNTYFLLADKTQHFIKISYSGTINIISNKNGDFFISEQKNNLNIFYNSLFSFIGPLRYVFNNSPIKKNLSLGERDDFITALKNERIYFLEKNKSGLKDEDILEVRSVIESASVIEKLKLYTPGLNQDKINEFYKDSLRSFLDRINNSQNSKLNPLIEQAALRIFDLQKEQNHVANNSNLINNLFTDPLKSFVLGRALKEEINDPLNDSVKLNKFFSEYIPKISIVEYIKILNQELDYYKIKKSINNNDTYLFSENGESAISNLIKSNANNIIYLDFWASWCIPCLKEFPISQKLQEKFKDKGIAFVFLSVDNNKNDWLDRQKAYKNIIKRNGYLIINGFKSKIAIQHKISTIPRYMIIGKKGEILIDDAPRPSDPELEKLLDKLLNKDD